MDRKHTGSTPIAPQLIGCHQTNLQIRDPHQISYRFDVFKTKSMIWPKKKGHCRALERMLLLRHALKLEGISITKRFTSQMLCPPSVFSLQSR